MLTLWNVMLHYEGVKTGISGSKYILTYLFTYLLHHNAEITHIAKVGMHRCWHGPQCQ